jgi:hypothetical protein
VDVSPAAQYLRNRWRQCRTDIPHFPEMGRLCRNPFEGF